MKKTIVEFILNIIQDKNIKVLILLYHNQPQMFIPDLKLKDNYQGLHPRLSVSKCFAVILKIEMMMMMMINVEYH